MADNKLEIDLIINDKDALNKLKTALQGIGAESKKTTDSANLSWAGFAAQLFVAQQAIAPVIGFMAEAVKEAAEQEDAINRLNTALKLQGTFTQDVSLGYQQMATDMARSSRFADEAINDVQQRLVAVGNVTPSSMKAATQATLDLATALRMDLTQASTIMAKAAAGNTAMLEKQIPALKGLITDGTSYAEVLRLINKEFGGSAAADLNTFAGQQENLKKEWKEVLEALGGFITKSPAVTESMRQMAELAGEIAENLEKIREQNPDLLADIWDGLTKNSLVAVGARLAGGMAGGAKGMNLASIILGTAEENQQKVTELAEVVVTAQRTAQEIWLAEQDQKESAARAKFLEGEIAKVDQLRIIWDQWNNEKNAKTMTAIQAENDFLQLAIQTQVLAHQSMWKTVGTMRDTFQSGMAGMFKDMMRGNLNAQEAFKQLGLKMLDILIDYGVQLAVNAALSKSFSAAQVGVSTATAAAVAAAWAPAAASASLATIGSNSAAAAAALTSTHALSRALSVIPGAFEGANVVGGGAVLVGERGPELLDLPSGARVTPLDRTGGRGDTHINIEINNPIMTTDDATRSIARQIAREVSEFIDAERERL